MAAGNRKSSNKRKTQTKKERMAEMEKAQAFRVEVSNRGNKLAAVKLIAAIVFLVFLCTFMGLAMNGNDRIHPLDAYTYCAERHTGGGIIGGCLAYYMCQAFGLIGSFIILYGTDYRAFGIAWNAKRRQKGL